jgi:predicted acylesterase/phospholipase RssA
LSSDNKSTNIPAKERALVLQGGGSLGAYEAGAYKGLYEYLSARDKKEGKEQSITFNIIAGTSIGAMNAAVLTSYVVENNTYEGSAEKLIEFWEYLSKESRMDSNPFFEKWWEYWHGVSKTIATGEAARRYYSAKEFALFGVPNVFSPLTPMLDNRFFDLSNTWFRFSNNPLKRSLEKFVKFPIRTNHENNQPRLILVAVDVASGSPVTFDSYPKEDGSRKTEYGNYIRDQNRDVGFEFVMRYDDGITADQVMASGSLPVNFEYSTLDVECYNFEPNGRQVEADKATIRSNSDYRKEMRYFWDGGLMANTPLSQLVLLHRRYWYLQRGLKDKVPALGVCVINVHPSRQEEIPTDHDGVLNRNSDIAFSDRSHKEEEILLLLSDYVELVRELIRIAKEKGVKEEVINNLMNQQTAYRGQLLKPRQYKEIVEGRFDIAEVIRIERKNNQDTISDKTFDFSAGTIRQLLGEGYNDTIELSKKR